MKASSVQRGCKPARVVVLPPSAFADDWEAKPQSDVAIGLRLVSQADLDTVQKEADKEAAGFYAVLRGAPLPVDGEAVVEARNEALIMGAVARGTCDPNDVRRPYFRAADDTVRYALTPEGARRIWDELVLLHKTGPHRRAATDEEVARLASALADGLPLDDEARKLCAYLLEKLGVTDDDEPVYVAKAG